MNSNESEFRFAITRLPMIKSYATVMIKVFARRKQYISARATKDAYLVDWQFFWIPLIYPFFASIANSYLDVRALVCNHTASWSTNITGSDAANLFNHHDVGWSICLVFFYTCLYRKRNSNRLNHCSPLHESVMNEWPEDLSKPFYLHTKQQNLCEV
jgi:hypothetical protein